MLLQTQLLIVLPSSNYMAWVQIQVLILGE